MKIYGTGHSVIIHSTHLMRASMRGLAFAALAFAAMVSGVAAQAPTNPNPPMRMPVPRVSVPQTPPPEKGETPAIARSSNAGKILPLDRVIAVVNDDALTQLHLD